MKTRKVGRTSVEVTEFSFGCTGIGNLYKPVSRDEAAATLQVAWDAGIRYFDTAPRYGHGLAELRLGDFLYGKARDSYVVSTKVGRVLRPVPEHAVPDYGFADPLPFAADYDYSYDGIMRAFDQCLTRLGLNRIDIVYIHDIGVLTHGQAENDRHVRALLDSGFKALGELKSRGAIKAVGVGVNEVRICLDLMDHFPLDCILLAGRYSLLDRSAEPELLARCLKEGTSLVIGGVFNSGILATGPIPGATFDYGPASEDVRERVRGLETVASTYKVPLAAAAMQFPLGSPAVASVLIGTGNPRSLTRNLSQLDFKVDPAAWAEFNRYTLMAPDPADATPWAQTEG
ncbi:L-fucose dehydrogenase [Labrys miyagiensis]|uniref:L-fucose dehydrogenase n=1 Tax=Labrys miyagiensis TaxID=346912 RepID=A0ABQ6C9V7_9HYPH|nr:aldo/keto reductase [Labrys miyagiensis]GLS17068.1 L-fucose dehydrogenase [Labrys miyagiensis]